MLAVLPGEHGTKARLKMATRLRPNAEHAWESRLIAVIRRAAIVLLALAWTAPLVSAEEAITYETCVDCHDGYLETLKGTTHDLTIAPSRVVLDCVSCHSGAEVHVDDPSVENIGDPANASVDVVIEVCRQCHAPHAEKGTVGLDPHFNQETACVDCHSIHAGQDRLRPDNPVVLCERCHVAMTRTFAKRSNHPLSDGIVTCVSCHSFTGSGEPSVGHGASANCYTCHPEQSGPYLYDHPVAISFAVEGSGCTECHDPHGSANERLLTRQGSTLCRQCHGTPPGHRIKHSGLGTKLPCVECHSEVHGSNHNPRLLDPDLGMKLFPDCYQSGCHDVRP